jgi:hypothetical protein
MFPTMARNVENRETGFLQSIQQLDPLVVHHQTIEVGCRPEDLFHKAYVQIDDIHETGIDGFAKPLTGM